MQPAQPHMQAYDPSGYAAAPVPGAHAVPQVGSDPNVYVYHLPPETTDVNIYTYVFLHSFF